MSCTSAFAALSGPGAVAGLLAPLVPPRWPRRLAWALVSRLPPRLRFATTGLAKRLLGAGPPVALGPPLDRLALSRARQGARPRLDVWLTHDVDYPWGMDLLDEVLAHERTRGVRSAVFLLAGGEYEVRPRTLASWQTEGFLIGLHGVDHDVSLGLRPGDVVDARLAEGLARLGCARAFRAPGLAATPALLAAVGRARLGIDSSVPGHAGPLLVACHPVVIADGLVELPVTLRDDQLLREVGMGVDDALSHIMAVGDLVASVGGRMVLDTHPEVLALAPTLYPRLLDALLSRPDIGCLSADPRGHLRCR